MSHPRSPPAHNVLHLSSPLTHTVPQHLPTFEILLTSFSAPAESNTEPFSPTDTRKAVTSSKKFTFLPSQTCIRGSTPFFFFFLRPPIYSNTLRGTSIKVRSACAESSIGRNALYQVIFIASSFRAFSARLTWGQRWCSSLEAIFMRLNYCVHSSIVAAFNANRICDEKLLRVSEIKKSMKRNNLVLQPPTQGHDGLYCSDVIFSSPLLVLSHAFLCELQNHRAASARTDSLSSQLYFFGLQLFPGGLYALLSKRSFLAIAAVLGSGSSLDAPSVFSKHFIPEQSMWWRWCMLGN